MRLCSRCQCSMVDHDNSGECPDPEVAAPAARIYTPDSTGRCMVCGRPGGEHSRSTGWDGDPKLCPPAELAARRCETDAAIGSPVEVVDVDLIAATDAQTIGCLREAIAFLRRKIDGYDVVFEVADEIAAGKVNP
jgi:hypothetical protein